VYEYASQYALFGYTQSWGVGTLNALGIFYFDSNGTLPGCEYFQDFTLTEGSASLAASNTSLTSTTPTLVERQVGTAGTVNLTVTSAANPTATAICSGTTSDTYSIAGTITSNGSALSGVTVTLSGAATKTTTTDEDGEYSFTALNSGTYTITPTKTNYTFTPTSKSVTTSCEVQLGVDFTATTGGGGCNTWADVIAKYNQYVSGLAGWADVISCYSDYVTP